VNRGSTPLTRSIRCGASARTAADENNDMVRFPRKKKPAYVNAGCG
jgi:hypothetical protein